MNASSSEKSIRTWSIYRTKNASGSSMNAISFGFVATAILILMFIILAILEHLFRSDHSSSYDGSAQFQKLGEKASMVNTKHHYFLFILWLIFFHYLILIIKDFIFLKRITGHQKAILYDLSLNYYIYLSFVV